ncbi:MAG: DUF2357 domain-containing protein, partial [Bacteroidota bacterium]|nr:DUF2357 domain-containing protein [Bacteroidota bacterium]
MKSESQIEINLDSIKEGMRLWIDARRPNTLFDAEQDAGEHNEARFQIVEGCFYDYEISDPHFVLGDVGENIIQQHKRSAHLGTIAPNIFVGTLDIPIVDRETGKQKGTVDLEVQSVKSSYREDYRDMLELITEKCSDLILKANTPVSHYFEVDYTKDSQTLHQKFAFIKSVIGTDEFSEAVHRIVTQPVTRWTEISEERDIRNARRLSNASLKEILKGGNRIKLAGSHPLKRYGLDSLPDRIA